MPANLNALIRYKTIDRCLGNPYRKWRIGDLVEACSDALREHRGTGTGISERTVRDDLRVMRSDILGFNAPIEQKEGFYTYGDPSYSIFRVSIRDAALLRRILDFIAEIRNEVDRPGLDDLIQGIRDALLEEEQEASFREKSSEPGISYKISVPRPGDLMDFITEEDLRLTFSIRIPIDSWGGILERLFP
jgi:hypothetical protein